MVKLRGINVYPMALAQILNERTEFAGEYVCRAWRDPATGRDEMTIVIETRAGVERTPELARAFSELLTRRVAVELRAELVAPGATAPLTEVDVRQKPKRLVDERP
jgi:phenylacetate-CoA ligase